MKSTQWLAVTTVILASLPLTAQQIDAGGSQIPAHALALAAEYLRPVSAQLEGRLDAKTAKPGDRVVVKTTHATILADGTEIPKGSRLVGRVTQVEAHSKDHAESELSFTLDRAELKGGIGVPIHAMIQSVAPPPTGAMSSEPIGADDGLGATAGGAGTMAGGDATAAGGSPAGAGPVGGPVGPAGGSVGGGASTPGRAGGSLDAPAGGEPGGTNLDGADPNGANPVAGGAAGPVDRTLAGSEEGTVSMASHFTEIPGVMLRGYIVGSQSGTLSAAGKNVRLDSGTQMLLGLAAK